MIESKRYLLIKHLKFWSLQMLEKLVGHIEAVHVFKQPEHKEGSQVPQSRGHGLFSNQSQ